MFYIQKMQALYHQNHFNVSYQHNLFYYCKTYSVDDAILAHSSIVSDLGILTAYASSALLDS